MVRSGGELGEHDDALAVEPGGWQANSVAVNSGVWSMIHIASGPTISVRVTWYT